MAIRIRRVKGIIIAVCAAKTGAKEEDIYLDDSAHHALSEKFYRDFAEMGFMSKELAHPENAKVAKEEETNET